MNIARKLRALLWCRDAAILLVVFAGIALFLALLAGLPTSLVWWRQFGINLVYSQSIGFSIYLVVGVSWPGGENMTWRTNLALIPRFVLGGWLGTLFANLFFWVFVPSAVTKNPTGLLTVNTVLAVSFGAIIAGYFGLRERISRMVAELSAQQVREHELQRRKTEAELEALRAKVNPHFLFNTLNSIASLIPSDAAGAERMVQRLSSLLRYALSSSTRQLVPLAEEIDAVRSYLEIEKIRLGTRLTYEIEAPESVTDCLIPGFLLQPLVENSIRHGISNRKEGGRIDIACNHAGGECVISVSDTGGGFAVSPAGEGFGLSSVEKRLDLLYDGQASFELEARDGFHILIRIPWQTEDDAV